MTVGGVRNGDAEEDSGLDLDPGAAAMQVGTVWLLQGLEPSRFGVPFATWLKKQERPCRKGKG